MHTYCWIRRPVNCDELSGSIGNSQQTDTVEPRQARHVLIAEGSKVLGKPLVKVDKEARAFVTNGSHM